MSKNPQPVHVSGTPKGEEQALKGRGTVVIQTENIIEARVIRPESMLINGNPSFPGWGTFRPPSITSLL